MACFLQSCVDDSCSFHRDDDDHHHHPRKKKSLDWLLKPRSDENWFHGDWLEDVKEEREKCSGQRKNAKAATKMDSKDPRHHRNAEKRCEDYFESVREALKRTELLDMLPLLDLDCTCRDSSDSARRIGEEPGFEKLDAQGKTMLHNVILYWQHVDAQAHAIGLAAVQIRKTKYERLAAALCVAGHPLEVKDSLKVTPFLLAIKVGATVIARILIACGADIHVKNAQHFHPLIVAAEQNQVGSFALLCRELKRRGDLAQAARDARRFAKQQRIHSDDFAMMGQVQQQHLSHLFQAHHRGPKTFQSPHLVNEEEEAKTLYSEDDDNTSEEEEEDEEEEEKMPEEVKQQPEEIPETEYAHDKPLRHYAKYVGNGYTSLHFGVVNNSPDLLKVALEYDEFKRSEVINKLSSSGTTGIKTPTLDDGIVKHQTALHKAVVYGHFECAEILLHYKADPDRVKKGDHDPPPTKLPLYSAVCNNDLNCTMLLLDHGASTDLATHKGLTIDNKCLKEVKKKAGLPDAKQQHFVKGVSKSVPDASKPHHAKKRTTIFSFASLGGNRSRSPRKSSSRSPKPSSRRSPKRSRSPPHTS